MHCRVFSLCLEDASSASPLQSWQLKNPPETAKRNSPSGAKTLFVENHRFMTILLKKIEQIIIIQCSFIKLRKMAESVTLLWLPWGLQNCQLNEKYSEYIITGIIYFNQFFSKIQHTLLNKFHTDDKNARKSPCSQFLKMTIALNNILGCSLTLQGFTHHVLLWLGFYAWPRKLFSH